MNSGSFLLSQQQFMSRQNIRRNKSAKSIHAKDSGISAESSSETTSATNIRALISEEETSIKKQQTDM